METAPLKSFATAARTELIREVTARITAVLAQGSPERIEQPKAVAALERAIAGGGGGDKGKGHLADKVAYTWFNRIVALRFMDANGYTGIGVVSPPADQVGQPEVLSAAKRGQVDTEVVKGTNAATITGLLNGTRQPRPGVDPQAEAYSLLLADYCRYWNKAMPFMFEREGDFTELLIPANLLADDSALGRSVKVLTAEVCQDVEVIGWLYQFYIAERKDEVFAGFKKNKKAGADEIPAATQLFTPHWIVRYLVENSLGRLWMLNRPSSGLASQMDYYIAPVDEETDFLKISEPEELKVIDPACGSGHMLTYAFDLLYAIYAEEGYAPSEIPGLILANNLYGTEIDPRAGALAAFALTMKASAKRKLFLKNPVEPNICVLDPISFGPDELAFLVTKGGDKHAEGEFWNQFAEADTLGSLITPDVGLTAQLAQHLQSLDDGGDLLKADVIEWAGHVVRQAEYLTSRYSVVVANPPYMGGGNMGPLLSVFAKESYPASKADLFAMFIERALRLVSTRGMAAMITMQGWAFLSSYEKLRHAVLSRASLETFAHLGTSAFDSIGGAVVSTAAFVLEADGDQELETTFVRLTAGRNEAEKERTLRACATGAGLDSLFTVSLAALSAIPGRPFAYWVTDAALKTIREFPQLSEIAKPRQGLATSDNNRFLKQWWEPGFGRVGLGLATREDAKDSRKRWFPCQKGGSYRKWYGNHSIVVDWEHDGAAMLELATKLYRSPTRTVKNMQFYFREGGTWSTISASSFAMRYSPPGFISETKGAVCFADDPAVLQAVIAYANSTAADYFLGISSPTLDFHEGPVGRLPFDPTPDEDVVARSHKCIAIAREDWDSQEESWDFGTSPLVDAWRMGDGDLREAFARLRSRQRGMVDELRRLEEENNVYFAKAYGLDGTLAVGVAREDVTLVGNADFRFASMAEGAAREAEMLATVIQDLVSYAVGCMFGRYSLDVPGVLLADQGATLQDYLATVPNPTFAPDTDNVIPIVDGDWFEDDVVGLFRKFLRGAFGEQHFEENLKFVTESLGVRSLRDYFITRAGRSKFYDDHVQRYKKRPIYWLFSSPKGSFNALVYMHRYTPSSVSTVLTYLREYATKLESSLQQAERAGNAKEADRLRKILVELNEYEHDTLYPKASENVALDLDDGVKTNYPKFGAALKKITGLEASSD